MQTEEILITMPVVPFKKPRQMKYLGCDHGRPQRKYSTQEGTSPLTVPIESVTMSCVIDTSKERDVTSVDIPG